jgi:hypothetical protein
MSDAMTTTHGRTVRLALRLSAAVMVSAAAAMGDEPPGVASERVLLDAQLRAERGRLLTIDAGTLSYEDHRGSVRSRPRSDFVGFLTPSDDASAPALTFLELTDSQRFVGRLIGGVEPVAGGEAGVQWDSSVLGPMVVSLENIRLIVLMPRIRPAVAVPDHEDAVVMANGDVVTGFVERIGESVAVETGTGVLQIPVQRVAQVRLATPGARSEGAMLWTSDGSVLGVGELRTNEIGDFLIGPEPGAERPWSSEDPGAGAVRLPPASVLAAAFDAARLAPLASLDIREQGPTGGRRWTPPARIGEPGQLRLADVELPGPMRVVWSLPRGASRFTVHAQLPATARTWGDCEMIVSAGAAGQEPTELLRRSIDAQNPSAELTTPIPPGSGELIITVQPGPYGPIQNRVLLRRGLILLER